MKKILITALLASGLAGAAYGQAPVSTDVILGFRATGGTGATQSLEINLGTIATLKGLTPGAANFVTNITSATDGANGVDSIYGSSWASDSNLLWGSVGAQTTGNATNGGRTLFGTAATNNSSPLGVQSTTPYTQFSYTGAGTSTGDVANLYNNGFTFTGTTVVGNSAQAANGTNGSWMTSEGTTAAAFDAFPFAQFENTTDITGAYVSSDLYELDANTKTAGQPGATVGNPGTFLGTLEIFSNGNVDFTPVAIPEPSVYAAILGAACLAFVAIRRHKQQTLV